MSLLLSPDELAGRGTIAQRDLRPLAESLASDLSRVITPDAPLFVPEQKAMLSREGGRCARDGAMLEFDPFSPHRHRCPTCGEWYEGELHHRFWLYFYQLWLAERALHAAVLGGLGVAGTGDFAARVLDMYVDLYPRYPNVDNALGPTRPFFSTYLESIWLLQLSLAADFIRASHAKAVDAFRDRVAEPSLELIRSFDEGLSNRQVWNNAAMVAAARLLGRDAEAESVVWAESGLVTHLSTALLADGTWYEGENYHFFAHRGLWYGVQLAARMNAGIPDDLLRRFEAGFRAPFLTTLPDLTFPSRRDSQYAVSLRQWRFAEMCELGLARGDDRVLRGMLARLYASDIPRGDSGRWKSTAEAERNLPAARLDRSDLGWKSLLFARRSLALAQAPPLPSVLLEAQGIGVIRRHAGRVYVALDYGISGGGHGHPDRLNLLVSDGLRRVLDDMGTGSYVDPSLHWYRSTLAHNAPMFDARSQDRVDGELVAFEDRGGAGWVSARAPIASDALAARTVIVMPEYLIDEVTWHCRSPRTFDLPLHFEIASDGTSSASTESLGSQGLEDGFRFLRAPRRLMAVLAGQAVHLRTTEGDLWLAADTDIELWTAVAPGAPGKGDRAMSLVRAHGSSGTTRWMWSWTGSARAIALHPQIVVECGPERHEHLRVEHGWQVAIHVAGARSTIDLEGLVPSTPAVETEPETETYAYDIDAGAAGEVEPELVLAGESYRQSEETWEQAGRPSASLKLAREGGEVRLQVVVRAERTFVPPGATNRLDNEHADINGAGLQLYLADADRRAGYVIVPREGASDVRIRPIDGWGSDIPVSASWLPTADGYAIDLRLELRHSVFLMDLIVNEKPAGRERRRGQLVLSGGRGESVYLRGDRHDPSRLIEFELHD